MKILWVLVNYYADDEIIRFIQKFSKFNQLYLYDIDFVIVDNSNTFNGVEVLDNCQVIKSPNGNCGYLPAFSFAVNHFVDEHGAYPDFSVLSNSDLTLPENIMMIFDEQNRLGFDLFSPQVLSNEGGRGNPFLVSRPSVFKMISYYLTSIKMVYNVKKMIRKTQFLNSLRTNNNISKTGSCYAVHGSIFSLSKLFFERGGSLSQYTSFLYCEEIFLAEEVRRYNGRVGFTCKVQVHHEEHKYVSQVSTSDNLKWYRESISMMIKKLFLN